jgi:hypothetical protein
MLHAYTIVIPISLFQFATSQVGHLFMLSLTDGIGQETVAYSHKETCHLRDSLLCSHPPSIF